MPTSRPRRLGPLLMTFAPLLAGCYASHTDSAPEAAPIVRLEPAVGQPVEYTVELAETDEDRITGLMYRTELASDAGMLFVFPPPEVEHSFWMKNTYIALDMIFISADQRVVGVVANAAPQTTTSRTVGEPSLYVLEVNAGQAALHGITAGTRVSWRNFTPQAR